ncbi:unnamed protein product, partial [Rotaria sp. Silwood1]
NKLTINRSKSDGIVENNDKKHIKLSPYTMFYRKLYEYVLSRLDLICCRLYGSQSNKFERIIWNLFENYTQLLFRSRLIQVYKSMPNSKLKTVRDKNSCLTPSKPAGTINLIDGYIIGDITSFYKEIFLNIPNLDKNLKENRLIDLPYSNKIFENIISGYVNVNISSINYSLNKIQTNSTPNVLSSSIQVGNLLFFSLFFYFIIDYLLSIV